MTVIVIAHRLSTIQHADVVYVVEDGEISAEGTFGDDVTPFFRSESYESRLAASVSWQEDCEHHDEKEETAFA